MFWIYVFGVKVFGCPTKAQLILEHNLFKVKIFLKSNVVFKTSNVQVFFEKILFLGYKITR